MNKVQSSISRDLDRISKVLIHDENWQNICLEPEIGKKFPLETPAKLVKRISERADLALEYLKNGDIINAIKTLE